ncbi:LacI family transcriptional regulator [Chloroflexi bacterium TSY]|nr:LacI family transcriptional regulator [Chloroflexi bacterium TSY]
MSITIAELSRQLGLSQSTVSKALNERADVSDVTRARVLKAAVELGYQPSAAARNLRRQRTDKIGMIVNYPIDQVDDFLAELIPGAAIAAERAKYNLILYTSVAGQPQEIARLCRAREVDGVILLWPPHLDETIHLIKQERMPFIVVPRRIPRDDVAFVAANHVQGAKLLTQHFIEQGHKPIAFISRPETFETDLDRRVGYRQALTEANLPFDEQYLIETDSRVERNAENAFSSLMALDVPPTAILVFTDPMAVKILSAAKEMGLDIPTDVAIAEIGRAAAESLLVQIQDPSLPASQRMLPVELVVRESSVSL